MGLERHGQFLLLSAQLHLPLVQVYGQSEDVVDFPWYELQWFCGATLPPAAPLAVKGPAIGIISDTNFSTVSTLEICAKPTQLRKLELARDLDFVVKLAPALGQLGRTAREPNVAMLWRLRGV